LSQGLATLRTAAIILSRGLRISAMNGFKEKFSVFPIDVMVVLAINIVVAAVGYYAIIEWGLFIR
jgi:hypothetical protein